MQPLRVLALAVGAVLTQACSSPRTAAATPGTSAGTPTSGGVEAEEAAAQRALRRMFPTVEGTVTRDAIAAELRQEAEALEPSPGVRSEATRAIQSGDFDRARDLLGELLAGNLVERARGATEAGDPRDALTALDRALEMAPRSPSILCARGEAILALPDDAREPKLLESALANFQDAAARDPERHGARAWLGASRAARKLGKIGEACDDARRGLAAAAPASPPASPSSSPPANSIAARFADPLRRSFAEAAFDDFLAARNASGAADAVAARARTSKDALLDLLGRAPDDAWTWARLAEIAEAEKSPADARDLAARGLAIAPDDASLLGRLALAARSLGGASAAVETFERLCREQPDVARAAWEHGLALYDAAIEDSERDRDPAAKLAAAEEEFQRAADLATRDDLTHVARLAHLASGDPARRLGGDPALASACGDLRAQCRGASALAKLRRGDLAGAHKDFLSMEDVRKGGLALEIRSTHEKGTDGLLRVANAYAEPSAPAANGAPAAIGAIDGLEQAAKICDLLHEVDPRDARFAAAAGTYHGDAAIHLELKARALAGQGKTEDAERLLRKAREAMEAAFAALRDAVALAPDDERVLGRAGSVLANYLQRDAPTAVGYLESAVRLGESKIPKLRDLAEEPNLAEAERRARRKSLEDEETLVGDACKDLGTVHLTLLGEPAKAREWLDRSRKAGPDPRPEIEGLLARCTEALASKIDPRLKDENRWAAPPSGR